MSDDNINIKVKMTSTNTTYDIQISKTASVLDLKKQITEKSELQESQQNLVYKGRILADDKTLADYNIQNDHTIILVKKYTDTKTETKDTKDTTGSTNTTSNTGQQSDPFNMLGGNSGGGFGNLGGLGGMGGLGGNLGGVDQSQINSMLGNPMYMNMVSEMLNDPNTLNMVLNNPQIKPLLDANPQLRAMMSNPQMLQMMLNPQMLQSAMSMMGGQGGNTGGTNPFGGLSIFILTV
jgi:ubiquilin